MHQLHQRLTTLAAAAALAPLVLLSGCANPIYHASGSSPDGRRPDAAAASAPRGAQGGELQSWTSGSPAPAGEGSSFESSGRAAEGTSFPGTSAPGTQDLGWGQTAPGDRTPRTSGARAVAPGSTGAGVRSAIDPPSVGNPPLNADTPVVGLDRGATGAVPGQSPGTVETMDSAPRGVDTGSSRAHLFEQFGRLEEDRNGLRQQVNALQDELERMQTEAQKRAEIEQKSQLESANLRAQISQLEEVNRQLSRENEDLAGRLLTAQIRRLEAEKTLLEHLIEAEKTGAPMLPRPPVGPSADGASEASRANTSSAAGATQP